MNDKKQTTTKGSPVIETNFGLKKISDNKKINQTSSQKGINDSPKISFNNPSMKKSDKKLIICMLVLFLPVVAILIGSMINPTGQFSYAHNSEGSIVNGLIFPFLLSYLIILSAIFTQPIISICAIVAFIIFIVKKPKMLGKLFIVIDVVWSIILLFIVSTATPPTSEG